MDIMNSWQEILAEEKEKVYFKKLQSFLKKEYQQHTVYPAPENLFKALEYTPLHSVRVVILGQDPYHEEGQAHGLAFSVQAHMKLPPSLVNIYKEIENDIGCKMNYNNGTLIPWAQQGVLLLNTVLSVRKHEANSHKGHGWEQFTDRCITEINREDRPIVFMLWGSHAQSKHALLTNPKHLILKAPHPSPLSAYRGFLGCTHFSQCNQFLHSMDEKEINWQIL